jgi:ketosteroid isomerase-like protein
MSRENVETIRRMYERWLQGDASLFDAFDQEIELHPDPAADWVGVNDVYGGHDGVRRYVALVYEAFEDYRPEVEDFLDAGDKVVTLAIEHGRGRGSGARVEARRTAHVWTMRANKAIRLDLYLDRAEALKAAGLCEEGMSAQLSERVGKLVGCPPLSEMGEQQRREFREALLDVDAFEDLPGKWQAAILKAEHNRADLALGTGD